MDPITAQIVAVIKDLGFPIAVAGYLLYRDYKFMGTMTAAISRMDTFLQTLQSHTPEQKAG